MLLRRGWRAPEVGRRTLEAPRGLEGEKEGLALEEEGQKGRREDAALALAPGA